MRRFTTKFAPIHLASSCRTKPHAKMIHLFLDKCEASNCNRTTRPNGMSVAKATLSGAPKALAVMPRMPTPLKRIDIDGEGAGILASGMELHRL